MLTPSINDNEHILIWKVAHNLWEAAGSDASGVSEPSMADTDQLNLKKAVSASSLL